VASGRPSRTVPAARVALDRSLATRDSVLLLGLLGLIEFLLITAIVAGRPGIVVDLGIGSLAAPLGALILAEAAFAIRPTQPRLARADRLVLVTVGIFFALGQVGAMATAIGGLG